MMRQEQRVRAWSATSVGMVREGNEDSLFHGTTTFAVADGMGGHQAGEVASAAALEPVAKLDGVEYATADEAEAALVAAVVDANTAVFEKAAAAVELRGMGTTLTAILVRESRFHLAHVGDSRAYLLRPGAPISQLTTDHTLVQQLIDEGRLSSDEVDTHPQRSVITRAIGVDRSVEVETLKPLEMLAGDQILICSDGLTGPVKEEEVAAILSRYADGAEACQALIEAANAAGGPDNITVVLLRVEGELAASDAARSTARRGDTQDLELPASQSGGAGGPSGAIAPTVTQIRTRGVQTEAFDAEKFGHYGESQGADVPPGLPTARARRLVKTGLTVMLVVGLVVAGAYAIGSQAYFVGNDAGIVAVFQGLPQQVAGINLSRIVERTDVRMSDLPAPLQMELRATIQMEDVATAQRYVNETLEPEARQELLRRAEVEAQRAAARARAGQQGPGRPPPPGSAGAGPTPPQVPQAPQTPTPPLPPPSPAA